ncbi:putative FBD-associated F-box protein At1g61330 isoform X1 [Aegilops tauschii subsp. strangulata]|uniref:F-box domain-containing protein n=3 Tax=Aegilops tauschii subsp. strangulata TaxID=200361 RepID=A0A452ZTE1_AEGTS|nr:putative FBD-associated F-box protein At1g61330 isoform X1 [Aegilops tauschii subsp. strangulata]
MSPRRVRLRPVTCRSRFAAIHDAAVSRTRRRHRHRHRLLKPHTSPAAGSGSKASSTETNGLEELPEDIIHHIHSLLPIQDAAHAACVSRRFRRSWRSYSSLILSERTLGLDRKTEEWKTHLIDKVDKILTNHYHNGVKVKTLKLDIGPCRDIKASYLDRWLRIIKPGIQEFSLLLPLVVNKIYSFPCSVLSNEAAASSIQSLSLFGCAFHPTSILGRLRRLKSLSLRYVHVTEDGLGHLLSKSSALEWLEIEACSGIICLKIPCTLQQLKFLSVQKCEMVKVVEIDAPRLCSFRYCGTPVIYVRNSSQLKNVDISPVNLSGILSYARFSLPSIAQNVESLTLLAGRIENANTPMLPSKLPHLKNLKISLVKPWSSPNYDVFSLVSFLDASPALESFVLRVEQDAMMHDPVVGDDTEYRRQNLECRNNSLRKVMITGFCSAKSLVELTVHILERTHSLERFTLDITYGYDRRTCNIAKFPIARMIGQCWSLSKRALEEAHRAVETADRYIKGRVPSSVQFEVLGPCPRCHIGK